MKYIKKILFICLLFAITGCSVEYNLDINNDLSISESVTASENTNKLQALTRKKGDSAVNYIFEMYKRKNENIDIISREKDGNTYATATTSHKDINDYASKFSSDVFDNVNVSKKDNKVTLIINQKEPLSNNTDHSLIYDDIKVKIKVPFKVDYNNADEVSGDYYIWNIVKNSTLKTIKIQYTEGTSKTKLNFKINNKTYNINYLIIVLSSIAVIILIIISTVLYNNKKNNLM